MTGTTSEIALGLRFEFYDRDELIAVISREDVTGATVPRAGERLGHASMGRDVEMLVGLAPKVHHIAHYLRVPGGAGAMTALCMVVFRVRLSPTSVQTIAAATPALQQQGWHVQALRYDSERSGDRG